MPRRIGRNVPDDAAQPSMRSPRRTLLRWTGWFGVANALLLVLVSLRNLAVVDAPDGLLPALFAVLMFVGHCGFLAALPALVLVPLILAWPRWLAVTGLATSPAQRNPVLLLEAHGLLLVGLEQLRERCVTVALEGTRSLLLGFELQEVQGDQFVWLRKDGAVLLLRPGRGVGRFPSYQAAPSAFVLYTEDLDRSMAELESKGLEFQGTDGSESCPTFTDPDGNWFQLVERNTED